MSIVNRPIRIFVCYAREDEALLRELEKQLRLLQRQGLVELWHDREISPGANWEQEITRYLNTSDIILLLVSPDFINSDYCYGVEMQRAMERHYAEEVRVIPVILRPVSWQDAPFGKIQALPTDAKPVTGSAWQNQDEALYNVAENIRKIIQELKTEATNTPLTDIHKNELKDESIFEGETTHGHALASSSVLESLTKQNTLKSPMNAPDQREEGRVPSPDVEEKHSLRSPNEATTFPVRLHDQTSSSSSDKKFLSGGFRGRKLSRRTMLASITVLGVAVGSGGILWWKLSPHPLYTYHPLSSTGGSHAISSLAWSPDGTRIASAVINGGGVQVWNAVNGSHEFTYEGHSDQVNAVAWSPDGKRIASASADNTVQVWDAAGGANVLTYKGGVGCVAWSPDGTRIASGGDLENTVQVWDAINAAHLFTYQGHSSIVESVVWVQNGTRIASGSSDRTVQVWNAADGSDILKYRGHTDAINSLACSSDKKSIASASDDTTVQVWSLISGNNLLTYRGHSSSVESVAWSPDGKRIASASADRTVQVWNETDGSGVFIYKGHSDYVETVAWSPDGTRIASGGGDETVQIWMPQ